MRSTWLNEGDYTLALIKNGCKQYVFYNALSGMCGYRL